MTKLLVFVSSQASRMAMQAIFPQSAIGNIKLGYG